MNRTLLSILASFLFLLLWAPAAHAGPPIITDAKQDPLVEPRAEPGRSHSWFPEFGVGTRIGVFFASNHQRDPLFAGDAIPTVSLIADVQPFESLLLGKDRLRLGLEWLMVANSADPLYFIFETNYQENHLMITADYGLHLTDWLTPYVRAAAGVAFYDLAIKGDSSLSADDYWLFSSQGAVGIELVAKWDVSVGFRTEVGHTLRAEPSFTLSRSGSTPEEQASMPVQGTELGSLPVDGWLWTQELFIRF